MNRAELLSDLRVFLADASEGSFTFSDDACYAALEKAQERCAAVLGLTYVEPDLAVDGNNEVEIPVDAISIVRVEIGEAPNPYYEIVVTPETSVPTFEEGSQVDPPTVMSVEIIRHNGHTAPINVDIPWISSGFDGFIVTVDGVEVSNLNQPYTVLEAPDNFTIEMSGSQQSWTVSWHDGVYLIGNDGDDPVNSNTFYVN